MFAEVRESKLADLFGNISSFNKGDICMNRDRFEIYWGYYLSIEKMLENTRQYVSPSYNNKDTYSDEFSKIILLSCSEIDSILKFLCELQEIDKNGKYYTIENYAVFLEQISDIKDIAYCPFYNSSLKEDALVVYPFSLIDSKQKYANLEWWQNYQNIKHDRIENVELGNLHNAVYAITAHYIVLRIAMDYLEANQGKDYVKNEYKSNYLIPVL